MRKPRFGVVYITLIWASVVILLATVLFIGYRRNMADLRQLMHDEAEQISVVAVISAQASIHALDQVEDVTAQRLLDNARFIEKIAEQYPIDFERLSAVIAQNNLHMVNILDALGKSEVRFGVDESNNGEMKEHHESVQRVLKGESQEEIIGFMESRYYSGKRYGVAVRRKSGGVVVVNTDSRNMLEFRKKVGLGTVFHDIGDNPGVTYVVLQDTLGIVAASENIIDMNRILDDPFLIAHQEGAPGVRFFHFQEKKVFEIVRPLVVDDVNLGLLRIGLNIDSFQSIQKRAIRQFLILFFAATCSGAFLLVYIMLQQNYRMLNREHDRILAEVRRMEEETRRSERLVSMGRLAAGVAHEIRNPLNAISIIAQRLKLEFEPVENPGEYKAFLTTIGREIERITIIIENFLRYVRPPKLNFQLTLIEDIIENAIGVVSEQARLSQIALLTDYAPGIHCKCDPEQFQQVILNLLLNALDAVHQEGTISILTGKERNGVSIRITDTGPGIPDKILPNIFDPYFTTKDKGSGLGLSEVHRIVSAHSGTIEASNVQSGGAQFTIWLPEGV
jgi:signal transduction histidine kinase